MEIPKYEQGSQNQNLSKKKVAVFLTPILSTLVVREFLWCLKIFFQIICKKNDVNSMDSGDSANVHG